MSCRIVANSCLRSFTNAFEHIYDLGIMSPSLRTITLWSLQETILTLMCLQECVNRFRTEVSCFILSACSVVAVKTHTLEAKWSISGWCLVTRFQMVSGCRRWPWLAPIREPLKDGRLVHISSLHFVLCFTEKTRQVNSWLACQRVLLRRIVHFRAVPTGFGPTLQWFFFPHNCFDRDMRRL